MTLLIIGCGSIGHRHALNASAFGDVYLYDFVRDRADNIAKEIKAQVFDDLDAAIVSGVDGIVIAVPTSEHIKIAWRALKAGVPILIEKPIADQRTGVEAFLDAAETNGVPIVVGCNMRFHIGPATLKRHLHYIGTPLFARSFYGNYLPFQRPNMDYRTVYAARRVAGGGVIRDSIHEIDYAAWLFGDVIHTTASAAKLSSLEIDVEDYAALCLTHSRGVRSEIHLDYLQKIKRRGCEIVGTNGTLIWESIGKAPERATIKLFREDKNAWDILFDQDIEDTNHMYKDMMAAFYALIKERGSVQMPQSSHDLLDGRGALKALSVCLKALEKCGMDHQAEPLRYVG